MKRFKKNDILWWQPENGWGRWVYFYKYLRAKEKEWTELDCVVGTTPWLSNFDKDWRSFNANRTELTFKNQRTVLVEICLQPS